MSQSNRIPFIPRIITLFIILFAVTNYTYFFLHFILISFVSLYIFIINLYHNGICEKDEWMNMCVCVSLASSQRMCLCAGRLEAKDAMEWMRKAFKWEIWCMYVVKCDTIRLIGIERLTTYLLWTWVVYWPSISHWPLLLSSTTDHCLIAIAPSIHSIYSWSFWLLLRTSITFLTFSQCFGKCGSLASNHWYIRSTSTCLVWHKHRNAINTAMFLQINSSLS